MAGQTDGRRTHGQIGLGESTKAHARELRQAKRVPVDPPTVNFHFSDEIVMLRGGVHGAAVG